MGGRASVELGVKNISSVLPLRASETWKQRERRAGGWECRIIAYA